MKRNATSLSKSTTVYQPVAWSTCSVFRHHTHLAAESDSVCHYAGEASAPAVSYRPAQRNKQNIKSSVQDHRWANLSMHGLYRTALPSLARSIQHISKPRLQTVYMSVSAVITFIAFTQLPFQPTSKAPHAQLGT